VQITAHSSYCESNLDAILVVFTSYITSYIPTAACKLLLTVLLLLIIIMSSYSCAYLCRLAVTLPLSWGHYRPHCNPPLSPGGHCSSVLSVRATAGLKPAALHNSHSRSSNVKGATSIGLYSQAACCKPAVLADGQNSSFELCWTVV
jgi:hypothetical protein